LGWWGAKVNAKKGTVLLIGHNVHTGGGFLNPLGKVSVGSTVTVSGTNFTVVSNRVMSKLKVAQIAPRLFSQTSPSRLVVVTCKGYNPVTGIYSSNRVLVAK
jgi:sortase (surface protein transpeptidase)